MGVWPYRFITQEEYETFVRDMGVYYLQIGARALKPPRLSDFAASPLPFFFEMKVRRDNGDMPDPDELKYFLSAYRDTEEYTSYCEDVTDYFLSSRFTHDKELYKGGGFTCLSY